MSEDFAMETRRENHDRERDRDLLTDDPRLGFLDRMDRRGGGSVPPPVDRRVRFRRPCSQCGVAFRDATQNEIDAFRRDIELPDTGDEHGCAS